MNETRFSRRRSDALFFQQIRGFEFYVEVFFFGSKLSAQSTIHQLLVSRCLHVWTELLFSVTTSYIKTRLIQHLSFFLVTSQTLERGNQEAELFIDLESRIVKLKFKLVSFSSDRSLPYLLDHNALDNFCIVHVVIHNSVTLKGNVNNVHLYLHNSKMFIFFFTKRLL